MYNTHDETTRSARGQKMAKELAEMEKGVQKQTAKICFDCKHALSLSRVYCGKLRRYVDDVMYCPHFEPEPPEYKLYRRT